MKIKELVRVPDDKIGRVNKNGVKPEINEENTFNYLTLFGFNVELNQATFSTEFFTRLKSKIMHYDLVDRTKLMNFKHRVMTFVTICLQHCKNMFNKREMRQQNYKRHQG